MRRLRVRLWRVGASGTVPKQRMAFTEFERTNRSAASERPITRRPKHGPETWHTVTVAEVSSKSGGNPFARVLEGELAPGFQSGPRYLSLGVTPRDTCRDAMIIEQ